MSLNQFDALWADGQKSQYDSGKVELYTNFFHAIFDSEEKLATYFLVFSWQVAMRV